MWSGGKRPRAHNLGLTSLLLVMAAAVCSAGCVGVYASVASAVGNSSTIHVTLRDDLPATFAVTSPVNGETVRDSLVVVEGTVHNVGQLMLYLDDTYYSTTPLDAGAETFSVSLIVSTGAHAIRLVAIDAVTNTQIETTLTVTYTPPIITTPTEVITEVGKAAEKAGVAVAGAGNELKSQIDQASGSGPMKTLTDVSFNTLRALDLLPVGGGGGIAPMASRVAVVTASLMAVAMPWSVYAFLGHLRFIPTRTLKSSHIIGRIRIVGVITFLIPFLFMR